MKPSKTKETQNGFTGLAKSVQAFNNQGFPNFRIMTLNLVNGEVVDISYSDAYASFECISKLEVEMEMLTITLNNNWEAGKTWKKR